MSKISLSPDASGTGIFTIASPNSNTNRTLTLPDDTGTIVTNSGNQAGSFTTLNTSGAVVFNDAGADVDFRVEGDTNANLLFVDASADAVGIGTGSPTAILNIIGSANPGTILLGNSKTDATRKFGSITTEHYSSSEEPITMITVDSQASISELYVGGAFGSQNALTRIRFYTAANNTTTGGTERATITSGGYFKATNSGNYWDDTGLYHEFVQTADSADLLLYATNASFSQNIEISIALRAASSAYSYYLAYSSLGGDLEFQLRGDGNAYADGSWNGSGADYAEYFESAGETIPRGTTVVLDNNKVRAATESDPASSIIGVVRPKEFGKGSMVVGNLAWNMWTDKYLTDDFGVYEMEDHDVLEWEEQILETEAVEAVVDEEGNEVSPAQEAVYKTVNHSYESHAVPEGVTVPVDATRKTHDEKGKKFQHRKLNPAWSADVEYTPREERPEWHIIGLLGQVPVLKGQPVGDRWIKMRDISETVEEWFIR